MFKQGSYIIDSDIRKIMIVECKQQTRRVKDRRQESSWGLLPAIQAAEAGSLDYTSSGRDGKAQKKKALTYMKRQYTVKGFKEMEKYQKSRMLTAQSL